MRLETVQDVLDVALHGHQLSRALYAAAAMELDRLAAVPIGRDELAATLGSNRRLANGLVDVWESMGLIASDETGDLQVSRGFKALLRQRRHIILHTGGVDYPTWEPLLERLSDPPANGRRLYEARASLAVADRHFENAQLEAVNVRAEALLRSTTDWTSISSFVDVGGGDGSLARAVIRHHSHLHATVFDLPYIAAADAQDQIKVVAGDIFEDSLPSAELYVLSQVLLNWDDQGAAAILRKILSIGMPVAIVETMPSANLARSLFCLQVELLMGGTVRSVDELSALVEACGGRVESISEFSELETFVMVVSS